MGFISDFFNDPLRTTKDVVNDTVDLVEDVIDVAVDLVGDVISWFVDIPELPDIDQDASSVLLNKNSNIAQIPVIYGERKVGGTRVFIETSGAENESLFICLVLCEGEVHQIGDIFINDENLSGSKYEPYVTIDKKVGTDTQSASTTLLEAPSWTSNDKLSGIAYLGIKIQFNSDVFSSIPTINAIVQGRKVFDPRDSSTAFSDNPVLCLRDYLTNTRYGKGLDTSLLDDTTFSAAANACDTTNETFSGSGVQIKRFQCNAVINTNQTLFNNTKVLLAGFQGMMPFQNGTYRVFVEDDYTATFSFTESNIISGFKIQGSQKGNKFNRVTAKFVNPETNYQADAVIFPDADSADYTTFLAEDNNKPLETEINLNTITSYYQARNIAKTLLKQSRLAGLQMSFVATPDALKCAVGDIVTVTHSTPAFTDKKFRVTGLSINYDATVNVSLAEHDATIYPWVNDKTQPTTASSNLPDPLTVAAPVLTVSDEVRTLNEEAVSFLIANVSTSDQFADRFEVQSQKAGTTEFVTMGQASEGRFEQVNIEDGLVYTVKARVINTLGVKSPFTTIAHEIVGKTAPPADVTGLTGNLIGNQYLLSWNAVADTDLSHYRLRFASTDSSMTYQNSNPLVDKVSRPATSVFVPARNGTYFVKSVDKLGLASLNPATVVLSSNIDELDNFKSIQTITESPDFNGTFDDTVEIDEDDRLVLNTSINFDSVTGNFDDALGLFDGGAGNVDAEGFYNFQNTVDLGAIFLVRATSIVRSIRVDYVALFDAAEGNFDSRQGLFDGDVNAFDDVGVEVQCRTTTDNPSGSPTYGDFKTFTVSDFKARGLQFRARLTTTDDKATPAVTFLSVQLDMGERVESGEDVASGAGAKAITFTKAFQATPAIGIGAQNLQTGDFYELSSKSRTGFTITFKNSSGSAIDRTFDFVAKGAGREVA
jgi:hypothetical protein